MTEKNEIALVACTSEKLDHPDHAWKIYTESDFYQVKLEYVRREHDGMRILSAKHQLLRPMKVIEPYEVAMGWLKKSGREKWSKQVLQQIKEQDLDDCLLVIHAGQDYRNQLIPLLEEEDIEYKVAFVDDLPGLPQNKSLGIGSKKGAYGDANEEAEEG